MSAAGMKQRIAKVSPRFRARIAGALYLLSVVTAASTELFLRGRLNVAGGLVANAGMAAVTLILYTIFKPVNKRLAFLAVFFNFVGLTFEALRLNPRGVDVALVFTGLYCLLIGWLMFRSTFAPRILGALMAFAGLGIAGRTK
jgi:FtsH-binding integral membrane protein